MKDSGYKSYDELPLFLNAKTVARVLGISPSSGYELIHQRDFPTLKIGSRIVVPKERLKSYVIRTSSGYSFPVNIPQSALYFAVC